ncbi:uncharacterized protein LOC105162293 [Sesamum indicum]|uniref:Uncharacterized protein LOC105162293 n=1 Tax=Sesamum indicum TaxID=4182 RepID=A0A8M8UZD5_SESIN|nr:uncharacterized protein LOC105162293 [Sesamum indicum]
MRSREWRMYVKILFIVHAYLIPTLIVWVSTLVIFIIGGIMRSRKWEILCRNIEVVWIYSLFCLELCGYNSSRLTIFMKTAMLCGIRYKLCVFMNAKLPDDATRAPFHAITLLETFELNSLELEDYDKHWCKDSHLKNKDDITLLGWNYTGFMILC